MERVIIPRLEPAMRTGIIVEWLRKKGDSVKKGDPILVVEGEKTTFEVESPTDGVILRTFVEAGDTVDVPATVALVGSPDESVPADMEAVPPTLKAEAGPPVTEVPKRLKASPLAKRIADEHGIELSSVKGTGPDGRITKEDVMQVLERQRKAAGPPAQELISGFRPPQVAETIPLTGIRKSVSERLSYGFRTTVPVTMTMEADMEAVLIQRDSLKSETGREISLTAFLVRAAAEALERHAIFNSSLDAEEIKIFREINIAVAVSTPEGLVAPVIREANRKSVEEISKEIDHLAEKALKRQLTLEEVTGGTFTLTNLGSYGIDVFAPVINPPQCAILGVGRVVKKPTVVGNEVTVRAMATLSLVFDHRISDGAPAADFLREIKRNLEHASVP